MAKLTFKNEPKYTGLMAVGNRAGSEIKLGGRRVGSILGASFSVSNFRHRVQIAVKDETQKCGWVWVMPKETFATRDEAKEWLRQNFDAVVSGRELHFFED